MNTIRPRKRFGQHFLVDENVLDKIISAISPKEKENILEVGPGTGALTTRLLSYVNHITAVELDRDLAVVLNQKFNPNQLTLIQQDILKLDIESVYNQLNCDKGLRIIGNLPYNISTPLIFHLLKSTRFIHDMVFMLQKEVAQRIAASPGNKNYGRLTVMTAIDLNCKILFNVPATAFNPPPKVESTVLQLTPCQPEEIKDRDRFSTIVKQAFSQRRKVLRNALQNIVSSDQFKLAEVDPSLRAENISVKQFVRLANA